MQYKAILIDIDGTLVVPGQPSVRPAVAQAVNNLQKQGIVVVIATGRTEFAAGKDTLASVCPDYGIYANGACVKDKKGKTVFEDRLTAQNMYTLVDFCEDYNYSLAFSFEDGYYVYVEYEAMKQCYGMITGHPEHIKDGQDQDRHLESMPFTAFVLLPPQEIDKYCEKYPGLRFVPYSEGKYDVFKPENTKAAGARVLLEKLGIQPSETVAVGDGLNDIEMLRFVGLGYAMGNAPQATKDAADRVAPSVEEDGLLSVIKEVFGV